MGLRAAADSITNNLTAVIVEPCPQISKTKHRPVEDMTLPGVCFFASQECGVLTGRTVSSRLVHAGTMVRAMLLCLGSSSTKRRCCGHTAACMDILYDNVVLVVAHTPDLLADPWGAGQVNGEREGSVPFSVRRVMTDFKRPCVQGMAVVLLPDIV